MYLEKCLTDEECKNFVNANTVIEAFPESQYYKEIHKKKQIVLHHTVSDGSSAKGDIATWLQDSNRIATSLIITENGIIHQCFDPKYWGHALGIKSTFIKAKGFSDYLYRNKILNQSAIQIELDSLGPVTSTGNSLAYGARLTTKDIVQYVNKYRGFEYFEAYHDEALETLYYTLRALTTQFEIDKTYKTDMWDVSKRALAGESGIWTHTSFRTDKSDCHPQKELIEVLKAL